MLVFFVHVCWFFFDALLVMSIERYLDRIIQFLHRTSVARHRLLTLLAILLIVHTTFYVISTNDLIICVTLVITISIIIVQPPPPHPPPPIGLPHFKLFESRRNTTSPERRTTINAKSISACLLRVACLVGIVQRLIMSVCSPNISCTWKLGMEPAILWLFRL